MDPRLSEILILVAGGAVALLAKRLLDEVASLTKTIGDLVAEVASQKARLEEGNRKFQGLGGELAALRARIERIDRDGCSKREDCR